MSVKNYFLPQSLEEALGLLAEHRDSLLVMGGGTVTMPLINEGVSTPEFVMGLRQVGLNYIGDTNGTVAIGATTTLTTLLERSPIEMLAEAARHTAAWSVRNLATIGGNFFVPPPAGDLATAMLALDARLKVVGPDGERWLPLESFYTGFMQTALRAGELLVEVEVPRPAGKTAFIKYGRKTANTPAVVTVAAHLLFEGPTVSRARLALNAVGPHPLRARGAEEVLEGSPLSSDSIIAAAVAAADECQPYTDAVASEWYRRKMVKVFVERALGQIAGEEGLS